MSGQHGLAPTPEIQAKDGQQPAPTAPAAPPAPAPTAPVPADPTQNGRTLPIGGADGQQANIYRPDGLPQHLVGQTDQETIDRLVNAYSGARSELAKGPQVPAKADDYTFTWSDKIKGTGSIADNDEAVGLFRTIAHEHGFSQKQIDAIPKFFDTLVDKGWVEKPVDTNRMLEDLAPASFRGTPEDKRQRGAQRLGEVETWIKNAAGYDDAMKQELRLLTMSAPGVQALEVMMRAGVNPSVQPAGGGGGGQQPVTREMLQSRTADPRNDAFGSKFDPDYAEETRRLFKQLYPDT